MKSLFNMDGKVAKSEGAGKALKTRFCFHAAFRGLYCRFLENEFGQIGVLGQLADLFLHVIGRDFQR
jgi:hypothetical protein